MPRYVILRHDPPLGGSVSPHWDFMLEVGDILKTWALAAEPHGGTTVTAQALADHRRLYLDYEGPLSQGRGQVAQWDCGTYRELEATDRRVRVVLDGKRLRCAAELLVQGEDPDYWTVTFSLE